MKKRILIFGGIFLALVALGVFNKLSSKKKTINMFTEVKSGIFEISVPNAGELFAEKSIDVMGPELGQSSEESGNQQGGTGGQSRPGGQGGFGGQGGRGSSMRAMDFKILDIVPEGTIVKEGDYIAQLDRTNYDNTLKDESEKLKTLQTNLEMKILDTTVVLTNLRDEIKNQKITVEEAAIDLEQSKYEPPATIRQAETKLNKQQRALEQKLKAYELRQAQTLADIDNQKLTLDKQERLVKEIQDFLSKFTVTAPVDGMVIYKKDRMGNKTKAGSSINMFDRVVATLPDLSIMISKTYVNEIDVTKIIPGQEVHVTIDAFPDKLYKGNVISIGNIGEQLPNSDAKMFEVLIRLNATDETLRPAMTTWNKIIIKTIDYAVFIPLECVQAGQDSIPYVYKRNKTRQIVILGDQNDKNVIVKKGLEPGTMIYVIQPEEHENFKLVGKELVAEKK
jgi:HlyD family secretion protein